MWMTTTLGFYSIVEKPKGKIQIRSRCRQDLENLLFEWRVDTRLSFWRIIRTPDADYRYRVILPREIFTRYFARLADLVTYDNFKTAIGKTNKHREFLYHKVWGTLLNIETEDESFPYEVDELEDHNNAMESNDDN